MVTGHRMCSAVATSNTCGFTKALSILQTRLSTLYERTKYSETHPQSLKKMFAPYRKNMLNGLSQAEKRKYVAMAGGKPMCFVDIINKINNCFYNSAEEVKVDIENLFAYEIRFKRHQEQAERARNTTRKLIKLNSVLPDDGIFLPQCTLNKGCRKPNGHSRRCMDSWYGPCRRPLFKARMIPTNTRRKQQGTTACSTMAQLVRWHTQYKFDKTVLEVLCRRSLCDTHTNGNSMQWYADLRELESAVTAGHLSKDAFLSSLLECAILVDTTK